MVFQFKRIWYLLDKIWNPTKVSEDSHFQKKVRVLQRCNKIGDALNEVRCRLMSRGPPHEGPTSLIKKKNKKGQLPFVWLRKGG